MVCDRNLILVEQLQGHTLGLESKEPKEPEVQSSNSVTFEELS